MLKTFKKKGTKNPTIANRQEHLSAQQSSETVTVEAQSLYLATLRVHSWHAVNLFPVRWSRIIIKRRATRREIGLTWNTLKYSKDEAGGCNQTQTGPAFYTRSCPSRASTCTHTHRHMHRRRRRRRHRQSTDTRTETKIYASMYTHLYIHVHQHIRTHTHTHILTHKQARTRVHTHTYTHKHTPRTRFCHEWALCHVMQGDELAYVKVSLTNSHS